MHHLPSVTGVVHPDSVLHLGLRLLRYRWNLLVKEYDPESKGRPKDQDIGRPDPLPSTMFPSSTEDPSPVPIQGSTEGLDSTDLFLHDVPG